MSSTTQRTTHHRRIRSLAALRSAARILAVAALAGAFMSACDVHGVSDPGTLASITVTPNVTMGASSIQQMVAVGHDADGRVVPISPTWSVAQSGGTINTVGMFTAGTATGMFANTVVATVGGISGSASINITAGPIASISLVPNLVVVPVGTRQTFLAIGLDAGGNVVPFTPTWSILAGGGTIDSVGNFTAGGTTGTYFNTVQASNNGIRGLATVT